MTQDHPDEVPEGEPLSARARGSIVVLLVFLAVVHVLVPTLAIDPTFLGLLALAAIVGMFDIERIEWLGIKARRIRRKLRSAEAGLEKAEPPRASLKATPPAIPSDTRELASSPPPEVTHTDFRPEPPTEPVELILWIAQQVRIELILLAGNAGDLQAGHIAWGHLQARDLVAQLVREGRMSQPYAAAVQRIQEVRNLAAHGTRIPGEVLHEAALLATKTIESLRGLPREYHRVRQASVPLYKDQGLSVRHIVDGVMLSTINGESRVSTVQVYPQGRQYQVGDFLAWEWDMTRVIREEAWYAGDGSGAKMAFSSAALFVGRPYPSHWGIEYRFTNPSIGLM